MNILFFQVDFNFDFINSTCFLKQLNYDHLLSIIQINFLRNSVYMSFKVKYNNICFKYKITSQKYKILNTKNFGTCFKLILIDSNFK